MERMSRAGTPNRRDTLRLGAGIAATAAALTFGSTASEARQATPAAGSAVSIEKKSVALETAQALITAAHAKAREIGVPMAVAIVDEGGLLKAFGRMDGVNSAATVEIVQRKAYTAAAFRSPTGQIAQGVSANGPRAASLANLDHFTLLPGGYPIKDGDTVVGGLGVGGGTPDQDQQIAEAALAAVIGS